VLYCTCEGELQFDSGDARPCGQTCVESRWSLEADLVTHVVIVSHCCQGKKTSYTTSILVQIGYFHSCSTADKAILRIHSFCFIDYPNSSKTHLNPFP